jgi:hypothetical protein
MLPVTVFQKLLRLGKLLVMWFMNSNKDSSLYYRELPLDTEEIERMPDLTKPESFIQALMQTVPGGHEVTSHEEPNLIREALLDSMELMMDQDKFIIDAIYWEMITFEELGNRLRSIYPTCMEIN